LIKKWRCIEYTDDGCSRYECLWCKATWEARHFPSVYCGNCGIRFEGEIAREPEPYDPAEYEKQSALAEEARLRRMRQSRWVIEGRHFYEGTVMLAGGREWGLAHDSDPDGYAMQQMTAFEVLALLKRYRAMNRYYERMTFFKMDDGTPTFRTEYRARVTAERGIPPLSRDHGGEYPRDVEYYERLIKEDEDGKTQGEKE
jgi:hypothetical protein